MHETALKLSELNDLDIRPVTSEHFKTFGRVLEGYDFSDLIRYMLDETDIPAEGNTYIASVPEMENFPVVGDVEQYLYGGMPVQVGYCNGRNTTYNGFEYHKGSEINIAATDFCLVLGHVWDIENNTIDGSKATVFFVPQGTAIEMYQTTLPLSPCRVTDEGFKGVVILPKGTNTEPMESREGADPENVLLLQKNKWVLAHPEREPLIRQGAHPGFLGPNREIKY